MRRQWWTLKESGDGWLAVADSLGGAVVIPLLGPPLPPHALPFSPRCLWRRG